MTLASPALHARNDGLSEYLPSVPVTLVQSALRIESMLTHGLRSKLVDHENDLVVGPSSHAKESHVEERVSYGASDRKFQLAEAHNISKQELADIVSVGLRRAFGDEKSAIKRIMRVANCNERAAENWYAGKNAPNALYLLRLIAEVPELQAEVRRLTAMESDLDPHFEKAMSEAVRLFQQVRKP